MSAANKQLVRDAMDALMARGDLDAADTFFHPEFLNHEAVDDRPAGPEGMKETARWIHETCGDPVFEEQASVGTGHAATTSACCASWA